MGLPSLVKAEVKLTTAAQVSVTRRELDAVGVTGPDAVGIVSALFVGGAAEVDGRWVIIDAFAWRDRVGASVSSSRSGLVALARTQRRLDALRRHVDELWPAFLESWKGVVVNGHQDLASELDRAHRAGTTREGLPRHRILSVEHRLNLAEMVDQHGEHEAGRVAQLLLAYLIALAGFSRVTNNAVGVPDFVLESSWNLSPVGTLDGNDVRK